MPGDLFLAIIMGYTLWTQDEILWRINTDYEMISKQKKVIIISNPPLSYIIANITPLALNVMYSYHAALCSKCQVLGIADAL